LSPFHFGSKGGDECRPMFFHSAEGKKKDTILKEESMRSYLSSNSRKDEDPRSLIFCHKKEGKRGNLQREWCPRPAVGSRGRKGKGRLSHLSREEEEKRGDRLWKGGGIKPYRIPSISPPGGGKRRRNRIFWPPPGREEKEGRDPSVRRKDRIRRGYPIAAKGE